jgi:hypothetical protein
VCVGCVPQERCDSAVNIKIKARNGVPVITRFHYLDPDMLVIIFTALLYYMFSILFNSECFVLEVTESFERRRG